MGGRRSAAKCASGAEPRGGQGARVPATGTRAILGHMYILCFVPALMQEPAAYKTLRSEFVVDWTRAVAPWRRANAACAHTRAHMHTYTPTHLHTHTPTHTHPEPPMRPPRTGNGRRLRPGAALPKQASAAGVKHQKSCASLACALPRPGPVLVQFTTRASTAPPRPGEGAARNDSGGGRPGLLFLA